MRRKQIVPPVLFPFTANEIEVLQIKEKYGIKKCDIYINYNYQEIHYELLRNYIDRNIIDQCYEEIWYCKNQSELMAVIENSMYSKYYKYFLCLAFREDRNLTLNKFKIWVSKKRLFLVLVTTRPNYVYEINKLYNTIIIPRIPKHDNRNNMFNRIHGTIPSYFDGKEIFNKSVECLVEGGRMFILDEKSRELYKNENLKRIADDTFEKKIKYRQPKEPDRVGWL